MSLPRRLVAIGTATAILFLVALLGSSRGDDLVLQPRPILLEAGEQVEFTVTAVNCTSSNSSNLTILCLSSDKRVLDCSSPSFTVQCGANSTFYLLGVAIGMAQLVLQTINDSVLTYDASVIRPKATVIDSVFTYGVIALLSLGIMGFGASMNLQVVRERLRRPKSVLVGLACQFTLMPTISFALCRMVSLPTPLALGVFATGCAPSGGGSNVWSKLLEGDVDLSIVVTFLTNIVAFAIMPLWIYTLGQEISEDTPITIPYLDMLKTLAASIVPLVVGILVARFLPKVGAVMVKAIVPLAIIFLVFALTFGTYANLYIFGVIGREPTIWIVTLLPFVGLLLAYLVALAARESKPSCITIAIETSIQSTGTAIILLRLSLEQPWSDMSLCVPILVSMFTPLPLLAVYVGKLVVAKLRQRKGEQSPQDTGNDNPAMSIDDVATKAGAEPDLSCPTSTGDTIALAKSSGRARSMLCFTTSV